MHDLHWFIPFPPPNAMSVSQRIWQMSHSVRHNLRCAECVPASQAVSPQEVVGSVYGYSVRQSVQYLRQKTILSTGDISQYPFVRYMPISVREASDSTLSSLDKSSSIHDSQKGSLTRSRSLQIWQMSHHVRQNPATVSHMLV